MKNIIITGGSGFIGTNLILFLLNKKFNILNLDKLSLSSNKYLLKKKIKNYKLIKIDLAKTNASKINKILKKFKPNYLINLASETHVDSSIERPKLFLESNVLGTLNLLIACVKYNKKNKIKFIHIGTDEVYGQLKFNEKKKFTENNKMDPRNPYSASKTSGINFVKSFYNTYDLPTLVVNPSNNFGCFQYPEKLIPKTILSILQNQKIQIYGKGRNIRDWVHVNDTANAIYTLMLKGETGETYNISSNNSLSNLELVKKISNILNRKLNIDYVKDRPGHDEKYLSSNKKLIKLGWKPKISLIEGLTKTVLWYKSKTNLKNFKSLKNTYKRIGERIK